MTEAGERDEWIANLLERVGGLERRVSEAWTVLVLLQELHEADVRRVDAVSKQVDLVGDLIALHLGLIRRLEDMPDAHH